MFTGISAVHFSGGPSSYPAPKKIAAQHVSLEQRFSESQCEKRGEKGLTTEGGIGKRLGEREEALAENNSR